jgi:photosystem II stability/assembly factor-like uncharacterized protein
MSRLRASLTMAVAVAAVTLVPTVPAMAGQASAAGPPLPAGFHAQSMSWISAQHGWVVGNAPCGQGTCTTVLRTTDAGVTWNQVGTIAAPLTLEQPSGVTEVRFADDLHGWAFDPAMWSTTDGGATWTRDRTPGTRPVVALAGDSEAVYAVVSACRYGIPISNCLHHETLWQWTAQQGWSVVQLSLPVSNQALLAVHGPVAYLAVPASLLDAPDVLEVTTDAGLNWGIRPDPCRPSAGETLTSITAWSDTDVALLCQGNIGFGKAAKLVYRSDDTAKSTHPAGQMPLYGIPTQLASNPDGVLVAASYSIGTWIYRNAGGKTWTTQVDMGDGGQGWNDVAFVSNDVGYVIHGPATCCGGQAGELWGTQDAGLTWGPVSG